MYVNYVLQASASSTYLFICFVTVKNVHNYMIFRSIIMFIYTCYQLFLHININIGRTSEYKFLHITCRRKNG